MTPQKEVRCRKIERSWRPSELRQSRKDAMPYHDRGTLEQPAPCRDESGSPDAKFILLFDPTFQGLENASVLNDVGSVETQLSLLRCFLACVPFVLVLFVSSGQLILFHTTVLPKKLFWNGKEHGLYAHYQI
jgi:hypothetical protein